MREREQSWDRLWADWLSAWHCLLREPGRRRRLAVSGVLMLAVAIETLVMSLHRWRRRTWSRPCPVSSRRQSSASSSPEIDYERLDRLLCHSPALECLVRIRCATWCCIRALDSGLSCAGSRSDIVQERSSRSSSRSYIIPLWSCRASILRPSPQWRYDGGRLPGGLYGDLWGQGRANECLC
jgi:hypothetical protein